MKWLFYVIVLVYLFFRTVYGGKILPNSITVDSIDYGKNTFWEAGSHHSINCKAGNKNQKVEWVDPAGNVVKRVATNRVFSQEHFVQSPRGGRTPALVLTFKNVLPRDAGAYECRSGDLSDVANVCVIEPLVFVDTPTVVTTDIGRSITLSCQAKGDPEPRIEWKRNGEDINDESDASKYKVMTKYNSEGFEGLLSITSLEPEDSGEYYCVAIQENPRVEDCMTSQSLNLTLNVNHGPTFEDGNDTKQVYGKENESVELVCAAKGYPPPTYRWFIDAGPDTLTETDQKKVVINEDNAAVLTVTADQTTFGQRYRCQVTNKLGTAVKYFTLLEIDKPKAPSEVEFDKSTDSQIDLAIHWTDPLLFPIDGFEIQYVKTDNIKNLVPKEADWNKGKKTTVGIDDTSAEDSESNGILLPIKDLEEDTKYWIRLRVVNDAGESPWYMPVLASTTVKVEEETEASTDQTEEGTETETEEEEETMQAELTSEGTFYGVFFAAGIIIVAVACMFAMRLV